MKHKNGRPQIVRDFQSRFLEAVRTAVSSQDWYDEMRSLISKMDDPKDAFNAMIQLTRFVHPQKAAISAPLEDGTAQVQQIVFNVHQSPKQIEEKAKPIIDVEAKPSKPKE